MSARTMALLLACASLAHGRPVTIGLERIEVKGDLEKRIRRNFDRLESQRFQPVEEVGCFRVEEYAWPGDMEGRTILSLALAMQGRWQMGNAGRMLRIGARGGREGVSGGRASVRSRQELLRWVPLPLGLYIRVLVAFESGLDITSPIPLHFHHESAPSDWFQRAGARAA